MNNYSASLNPILLIDFTKQYNRLRQHAAVRSGNAQGVTSSIDKKSAVATLPAVNQPKTLTSASRPKDKTSDQLAALVKYSSRIAKRGGSNSDHITLLDTTAQVTASWCQPLLLHSLPRLLRQNVFRAQESCI